MKASELRIGNWVEDENGYYQIESEHLDDKVFPILQTWGISLTEEICGRLGCYYGFGGEPRFELTDQITMSILFINGNILCLIGDELQVQITFVHQLQNLYFALTNEELVIKE